MNSSVDKTNYNPEWIISSIFLVFFLVSIVIIVIGSYVVVYLKKNEIKDCKAQLKNNGNKNQLLKFNLYKIASDLMMSVNKKGENFEKIKFSDKST